MQKLSYIFGLLLLVVNLFAQETPFVVEVAAYAQHAPDGHFGSIDGLYETLDANYIYRYYINSATKEDALAKMKEVQSLGFTNAKVIDFAELKENCDAVCQYINPKKTGNDVVPFSSLSTEYIDINHLYAIFFDFNKSNIRLDAKGELDKLIIVLKQNTSYHVVILAHTDARGSQKYNDALSMRRAIATQKYLTKKGIHRTKIVKKVFGEKEPIALNELDNGEDTELGRQFNRRVEFQILSNTGNVLNIVDKIRVPSNIKNN
jgi:outer membrane protein OmpA-like peptidoglycan-associated protein